MIYSQPLCCSEIKLLVNNWQATFKADGPCEPLAHQQQSRHPKAYSTHENTYDIVWWMNHSLILQMLQLCYGIVILYFFCFEDLIFVNKMNSGQNLRANVTMISWSAHSPSVFFISRHKARKPSHQLRWRPQAVWFWWEPPLNPHVLRAKKKKQVVNHSELWCKGVCKEYAKEYDCNQWIRSAASRLHLVI